MCCFEVEIRVLEGVIRISADVELSQNVPTRRRNGTSSCRTLHRDVRDRPTLQRAKTLPLPLDHFVVEPPAFHQLFVGAGLDDPALVQHDDQVGVGDRAQAVGDDEGRAAPEQVGQRGLDELLALGVEVARGFVEDRGSAGRRGSRGRC